MVMDVDEVVEDDVEEVVVDDVDEVVTVVMDVDDVVVLVVVEVRVVVVLLVVVVEVTQIGEDCCTTKSIQDSSDCTCSLQGEKTTSSSIDLTTDDQNNIPGVCNDAESL